MHLKDGFDTLYLPVSIAERGMVQKTLCSSGFKTASIKLGFKKQKADAMTCCFPLHICSRLSAVQKNDKLHQTETAIGGRVFLIFLESYY